MERIATEAKVISDPCHRAFGPQLLGPTSTQTKDGCVLDILYIPNYMTKLYSCVTLSLPAEQIFLGGTSNEVQ